MYPANKGLTSRRALRRFTSTHTTVVIIGGKSTCTAVRSIPYSSVRRDTSSFRMTPRHVYRTTRWPHRTVPDNPRVNRFIRTQTRSLARGQRRPRAHLAVNVRIKGPMCTSSGQRAHRRAQPARHQARTSPHGSGRTCSRPGFPSWHNWQRASPGTSHTPPPHVPTTPGHAKRPRPRHVLTDEAGAPSGHEPDYSRKFMPKSMAPSASRKSSDTEPSPKSASE